MRREIGTFLGTLIIFLVAVLFGGGALCYFYFSQPTTYDYETVDSLSSKKSKSVQMGMYINKTYGYSISYPVNWNLNADKKDSVTIDSPENQEILTKVNLDQTNSTSYRPDVILNYKKDLDQWASLDDYVANNNYFIGIPTKIQFAGQDAYEGIESGSYFGTLIDNNGHLYEIAFGNKASKKNLSNVEKDILNSFAFVQ